MLTHVADGCFDLRLRARVNARARLICKGTSKIRRMMQAEHALGYRNLKGRDGDMRSAEAPPTCSKPSSSSPASRATASCPPSSPPLGREPNPPEDVALVAA